MKKILILVSMALAALSARAGIITQTATNLDLTFDLKDGILAPAGADTVTYNLTTFPGSSFTFSFEDRLVFFIKDKETLTTVPSSGTFVFTQDFGDLDFSGSYTVGSTIVNWAVDSKVSTSLGLDRWYGRLTANARSASVPDGGTTLALLGLGLIGLAAVRRRLT